MAPRNGDGSPDYEEAFKQIGDRMSGFNETVSGLAGDVRGIGERLARSEESTKGLWKEMRSTGEKVDGLPDKMREIVREHKTDCPAAVRADEKIRRRTDSRIPMPERDPFRESSQLFPIDAGTGRMIRSDGNGGYVIPKAVLWIGCIIGIAIAAGGWLLATLGVF